MNVFDDMIGHFYAYFLECIGYPFHFCMTSGKMKNVDITEIDSEKKLNYKKTKCDLQEPIECNAIDIDTIKCLLNYFPDEDRYNKSPEDGNNICKFGRILFNESFMESYIERQEIIFSEDSEDLDDDENLDLHKGEYEDTDFQITRFLVLCMLSTTYQYNPDIKILHAIVELFREKQRRYKSQITVEGEYLDEFMKDYNKGRFRIISDDTVIGKIINEALIMMEEYITKTGYNKDTSKTLIIKILKSRNAFLYNKIETEWCPI